MPVLIPIFALFGLTLAVMARMGFARYRAVIRREVDHHYYEVYHGEEPPHLRVLSRHFSNLVETPPLFYIACIIAFVTEQQNAFVIGLAWTYVALRFLHSYIHLGRNVVAQRFKVFVASIIVLTVLFVTLLIGIV